VRHVQPYPDEWQLLRDLHPTLGKKGTLYFDRDRVEILYWTTGEDYRPIQFSAVKKLMNLGLLAPHPDGWCQYDITLDGIHAVEQRDLRLGGEKLVQT
jgi:hypothetical protein